MKNTNKSPLMYGIIDSDGAAYIGENCVASSPQELFLELNGLNDSPDAGYKIVALGQVYLDAAAPQVVADERELPPLPQYFPSIVNIRADEEVRAQQYAQDYARAALASAPVQAQEPIYQARSPEETAWQDIDRVTYDHASANGFEVRTIYSAPVQPVAVPDESKAVSWLCTDLDGHGDVGFTKEIAKQRVGYSCDYFIPLFDIAAPAAQGDAKERECCGSSEFCERDTCPTQDGEHAEFYRHIRDEVIGDDPEAIGMEKAKKPGLDAACRAAIAAKAAS